MPRPEHSERGATAVEIVILAPVLLLLITLVFQFGLWYYAESVARAAAAEGVRAARLEGGTAQDGQLRAEDFLAHAGPSIVEHPNVTATRDLTTAAVTVTGTAIMIVPGFHLPLRATATSPNEVFRPGQ